MTTSRIAHSQSCSTLSTPTTCKPIDWKLVNAIVQNDIPKIHEFLTRDVGMENRSVALAFAAELGRDSTVHELVKNGPISEDGRTTAITQAVLNKHPGIADFLRSLRS